MLPAGLEAAISTSHEPQTQALDRAAIGMAQTYNLKAKIFAHRHLFLLIYKLVTLLLHALPSNNVTFVNMWK